MAENIQLQRLFNYDLWANKKIGMALKKHQNFATYNRASELFAHIAAAQQMWHNRITAGAQKQIELWPGAEPPSDVIKALDYLAPLWRVIINGLQYRPEALIHYHNSKGVEYHTRLTDILHHVTIHGQHHRAQIAILLRKAGFTPPATDYIVYVREAGK